MKYFVVFLWLVLFSYLFDILFGTAYNIYYLLIGIPLTIAGVFLILYLFKGNKED